MEELAVYAILCSVGYDFNKEYNKALDKLFLENQKNNDYLELEGMQQKDAILHTLSIMNVVLCQDFVQVKMRNFSSF